uniref:Uncharacterized protein n=1 Tax=Pipistrellus kuhlii TaxID=59472 RepID=A0A7J7S5X7_PIPKU|nr:hypothetical protein mPipKuh1_010031 [Pipistrellus kuhlii]
MCMKPHEGETCQEHTARQGALTQTQVLRPLGWARSLAVFISLRLISQIVRLSTVPRTKASISVVASEALNHVTPAYLNVHSSSGLTKLHPHRLLSFPQRARFLRALAHSPLCQNRCPKALCGTSLWFYWVSGPCHFLRGLSRPSFLKLSAPLLLTLSSPPFISFVVLTRIAFLLASSAPARYHSQNSMCTTQAVSQLPRSWLQTGHVHACKPGRVPSRNWPAP